jgi:hypothetical protein
MPRRMGHREQGAYACKACSHAEIARVDFLLASGAHVSALAAQFGIPQDSLYRHYKKHVSERYKRIVGSSHLEGFEALIGKATEGCAETLDILDLLIRGHSQQWAIAMESGSGQTMAMHANKVLQATELRSKITRELVPSANLTVNNYLLHDAAQIVSVLQDHPEAADAVLQWHERRTNTRVIEHAGAAAD